MEIEVIYRKYFRDVFFYIRAISRDESLAEEITQETFVKAMKNIEQFDERKDIRAWLFTIARNTYCRHCRRHKIFLNEDALKNLEDTSISPLDQIIRDEEIQNARYNADLLTEPYRKVFSLRIYGELSFEQIGECFGKSPGWARVTYYRARKILQDKMR